MDESGRLDPSADPEDTSDPGTQYVRLAGRKTIPPAQPSQSAGELPASFGRYRVERCLGQGTMGAVYLANDTQLERQVALKIPKFTDGDGEMIERFFRESRAAATLRHANLCPVYDAGQIDGIHYLSMAYIEGEPLSEVLAASGHPAPADATAIVLKLAKALEAAHARGVVHRDLKPANIMIDANGEPIIMDFGLARRMNKEDSRLTQSGLVMGSPAYMSPEQVEGDPAKMGLACDVYSLGVIFYELLTGEVPFKGSIASVMGQIITAAPKKPSALQPKISPELDAICLKMMAKRAEDRFATMSDVVTALDSYLAGRPSGITIPHCDTGAGEAPSRPATAERQQARGVVISPWMFGAVVAILIAAFGMTWSLIAFMSKQNNGNEELKISPKTRQLVDDGHATILLNNEELTPDQLKKPLGVPLAKLVGGKNTLVIADGETALDRKVFNGRADEPSYLVKTEDGYRQKWNHRLVAEWVLKNGGKLTLEEAKAPVEKVDDLPSADQNFQIAAIDLSGTSEAPNQSNLGALGLLKSLKQLVLPRSVSGEEFDALKKALPDCDVKRSGA